MVEIITEELISEMVGRGMKRADLEKMRDDGYRYVRERGSFMTAPEFIIAEAEDE